MGNLPPKLDNVETILRSLFGHHGTIDEVLLLPGRTNFGFITFTTEEAAQAMVDAPRPHLQSATGPCQLRVGRDLPRQAPEPEAPAPRRGRWRFRDRDPDDNLLEQLQDAGARLRQRGRERDDARRERDAACTEVATLRRERDEALRERDAARKQLAARNDMLAQVLKEQQY